MDNGYLDVRTSRFASNIASDSGGAVYTRFTQVTIVESLIQNNNSSGGGGGIYAGGAVYIVIRHSTLKGNRAMESGGALQLGHIGATIVGTTISNNLAVKDGGGVAYHGAWENHLKVSNSSFHENRAVSRGGALFATGTKAHLSNSTFARNRAGGNGGAVYVEAINAKLTHITMMRNEALNGGGVYARTAEVLNMRNSIIAGSRGGDCAGGLRGNSGNFIEDRSCNPAHWGIRDSAAWPVHRPFSNWTPAARPSTGPIRSSALKPIRAVRHARKGKLVTSAHTRPFTGRTSGLSAVRLREMRMRLSK